MAVKAVLREGCDRGVVVGSGVEGRKRSDTSVGKWVLDGEDSDLRRQLLLQAERVTHRGDCAGVGGLQAGANANDMIARLFSRAAVALAAPARLLDDREIGRVAATAQGAVSQVRIQRQTFPAVAGYTAERIDRVCSADLRQVAVAGEAVFCLAGEGGNKRDRAWPTALVPRDGQQGDEQE